MEKINDIEVIQVYPITKFREPRRALCICPMCEKPWETILTNIRLGRANHCKKCGGQVAAKTKATKFGFKVPCIINNIQIIKYYPGSKKHKRAALVDYICPMCEKIFTTQLASIKSGRARRCKKCGRITSAETKKAHLKLPATINGILVLSRAEKAKGRRQQRVNCICPKCNKLWVVQLANIKSNKSTKCRSCAAQDTLVTMGTNEKELLDKQEKIDQCVIHRGIQILNFFVDGYCYKTNTVYEVYEKYHDKTIWYDLKREEEICHALHCDFVIIYDRTH